ncbi:MAG: hypothetical protein IJS12_10550 [Lachnospiraceae bacterium]|nr:hypothetical protein [Lachnospiraceae bacterium]
MGKELARGTSFPVYMYRDVYSHYGYPLPIFYCSLFLYPFSVLVALGLQALTAYKIMLLVCMWTTFLVAYICIGRVPEYKNRQFVGAFIYTLQPFLVNELFIRASIGAACVFIFIPIVLLGLYLIWHSAFLKGTLALAGGMAGIVSSHVVSTVLIVAALAVVYITMIVCRFNNGDKGFIPRSLMAVFTSAFICLFMTAWYIAPMIEQFIRYEFKGQTVTGLQIAGEGPVSILIPMHLSTILTHLLNHYVRISEIGGVPLFMLAFTIYLLVTGQIRYMGVRQRVILVIYHLLCLVLFIRPLWNYLGRYLGFMQFTWRVFLIISVLGFCVCFSLMKPDDFGCVKVQIVLVSLSTLYILIFFFGYYGIRNFLPSVISGTIGHEVEEYEYTSETWDNLYIPTCMDENILSEQLRSVDVDLEYSKDTDISYTYEIDENRGLVMIDITKNTATETTYLTVPFIMYSGYRAYNTIKDEEYELVQASDGMTDVSIPPGTVGRVIVDYSGTVVQKATLLLSIIAFVFFLFGIRVVSRRNGS